MTGGSGFIGHFFIESALKEERFDRIFNFDLHSRGSADPRVEFRETDVRRPISHDVGAFDLETSWIINLAALCREPGSEPREYFDTNVGGAENVTRFAAEKGFRNIFFTSTMSTFGRMESRTPEHARQYPETPYGISKALAEGIHRIWLAADVGRRLIICRPGVIFGPGDDQNIHRMIKAVRKGYFVFPGDPEIVKAYGYIHGLLDSIGFVLPRKNERLIIYNYAENPLLTLKGMIAEINKALGTDRPLIRVPMGVLVGLSHGIQVACGLLGRKSPIHPVRVRKVAFPTYLYPEYLIENGFEFRYPFEKALSHWKGERPGDFRL
ncbi:MAG TPA: NAD(P)-dependent oxidoreductase [Fibrobacteria bacterium]|nr:NAD(P)-dependent oxidoreductase [Fibrobacteria bacterium]